MVYYVINLFDISITDCILLLKMFASVKLDTGRDLNHSNQYIVGLALCALGNICSAEMAMDLAPEVERLLLSRDQTIKKKVLPFSLLIFLFKLCAQLDGMSFYV